MKRLIHFLTRFKNGIKTLFSDPLAALERKNCVYQLALEAIVKSPGMDFSYEAAKSPRVKFPEPELGWILCTDLAEAGLEGNVAEVRRLLSTVAEKKDHPAVDGTDWLRGFSLDECGRPSETTVAPSRGRAGWILMQD